MPAFPSRARAVRHFCSAGILPAPLVILSGACRLVLSENRIFTIFWSTRAVEESLFESLSDPPATYDDPPPIAIWKPRARALGGANWRWKIFRPRLWRCGSGQHAFAELGRVDRDVRLHLAHLKFRAPIGPGKRPVEGHLHAREIAIIRVSTCEGLKPSAVSANRATLTS